MTAYETPYIPPAKVGTVGASSPLQYPLHPPSQTHPHTPKAHAPALGGGAQPIDVKIDDLAARLERIEAMIAQLLPTPEPSSRRLVQAIYNETAETKDEWFLSGVLWRTVESERVSAEIDGKEESELSKALRAARITSAHGLGRWITAESWAFERGAEERAGVSWKVAVSAVNETAETAHPI